MAMKWHLFSSEKFYHQELPPERKSVLVILEARPEKGLPRAVAVGYRRGSVDQGGFPYFVVPGIGGEVVAWCDCLPWDFLSSILPFTREPETEVNR